MSNYVQQMTDRLAERLPTCPAGLLELYVLLALVKGRETTLQDVHNAWSVWTAELRPNHRSLIPFDDLTAEVQELDRKYMDAIHAAAGES